MRGISPGSDEGKHILITAIDKVFPKIEDALLMLKLETFLATGPFSHLSSISWPRSKSSDIEKQLFYGMHKPEEVVIVFLDNGRRQILNTGKDSSISSIALGAATACSTARRITPWVPSLSRWNAGWKGVALSSFSME
jgi:L-lactate utilization protein LutB